jgi:L-rhamnose mutarotase
MMAKRYGSVIKVRPEKLEEYKRLHAAVWPSILRMISECNIENYSIYYRKLDDGIHYLFSHFEYTGDWWDVCKPCQEPLETRKDGEWWSEMEEVFFYAG